MSQGDHTRNIGVNNKIQHLPPMIDQGQSLFPIYSEKILQMKNTSYCPRMFSITSSSLTVVIETSFECFSSFSCSFTGHLTSNGYNF